MADYEARRTGGGDRARSDENNTKNIRNATDVAIASGEPHAVAVGEAVKAADSVTGGKATEVLGKGLTNTMKGMPGGNILQKSSNRMAESGASDKIGKAASMYNGMQGNGGPNTPNQVKGPNSTGGGQNSSLPSSDGGNNNGMPDNINNAGEGMPANAGANMPANAGSVGGVNNPSSKPKSSVFDKDSEEKDKKEEKEGYSAFALSATAKKIVISLIPAFLIFLVIIIIVFSVAGIFSDYEDAVAISSVEVQDTGGINYSASTPEQREFFRRVSDIKKEYQANGKTIDSLKIVSVYHILNLNKAGISYDEMDDAAIREIADSMLSDNYYSEETFRSNLINKIFPKYLPNSTEKARKKMADDVFDYIERYYDFIGKNKGCSASGGSCVYDIKGFYIEGKGNVAKNISVSDLYVRLMQCGYSDGHNYGGTFGQPMEGEDLVPFEKYVLGAAYQEIGPSAPEAAIKAQLIATRSYALARPTEMGGWRKLYEENGKWILQAAGCTQDQVYCDPDQGCSSNDGQWGQIHSGLNHNSGFSRGPMPEDSPMRKYAEEVQGEVLINSVGNIIYAGFTSVDQNRWSSLARSGLDYKQILLQHYNQGGRNYGASGIQKSTCGGGSKYCANAASGDYVDWKQYRGDWISVPMGNSGKTIRSIGCLVTSVSIQIARSGVRTNIQGEFNPGTFVQYLNTHGGFAGGGNLVWAAVTDAAPDFKYQEPIYVSGWSREQKLNKLRELTSQKGVYVVAEVKGNTGQHWVAIDYVDGNNVKMMDPASESTDLWDEYPWYNTSEFVYYKVG